jgi:hypothetical protein
MAPTESENLMTREIDSSYRIGRCNYCSSRPVYAWPAASGLRKDDMTCLRCHSPLDASSREAHRIQILTDADLVPLRDRALHTLRTKLDRGLVAQAEFAAQGTEGGEFRAELWQPEIDKLTASIARITKAAS